MEVIGELNLYNKRCVESVDGDAKFIENCNPRSLAIKWNNIGINSILINDISLIKESNSINRGLIREVISEINIDVDIFSDTRNTDSFEDWLSLGARRVIISNNSITDSEFIKNILKKYPEETILLLRVNEGMTEIDQGYHEEAKNILYELKKQGLRRFIYHDVSANYEFNYDDFLYLAKESALSALACGKLNKLEAIKKLKQLSSCENIFMDGIILSDPLYKNTLDLYEVIKLVGAYPYIGDFYSREDLC